MANNSEASTSNGLKPETVFKEEDSKKVPLLPKHPRNPAYNGWNRFWSFFNFDDWRSIRKDFQRLDGHEDHSPHRPSERWCPEEEASFVSRFFYFHLSGLIQIGTRKHLVLEDLWDIPQRDKTDIVEERFNNNLHKSRDPATRPQGSVFKALWWTFGPLFLLAGLVKIIHDILQIMGPVLLKHLLNHIENHDTDNYYSISLGLVIAMFAASTSQTLVVNFFFHLLYQISLHIKSALVQMLYAKSLRVSTAVRTGFGIGKIVNLQSNDAARLWNLVTYLHVLWSGPFQIFLVLFWLIGLLGWLPSLGGLIVIIALIPVTTYMSKVQSRMRRDQMKYTDARVKATSEVVTGIKAIKLYAWEDSYVEKIQKLREMELKKIRIIGFLDAFSHMVFSTSPILVSGVAFGLFVWKGKGSLTSSVAFPALSLFNLLRFPVTMLPTQIMDIVNGHVALKRIQNFMDSEEMNSILESETSKEVAVGVKEGTFSWPPSTDPTLHGIHFQILKGKLVQIVGDVGSGKSSLLSALMGEMKTHSGNVFLNGSLAYTCQEPWIQNKTLKENILMENPFHSDMYAACLESCALLQDLEALAAGDETEIGEKGVNLSGGQKHRVALARACYSDADIYLLDDPLSAVDAHVGRHLFENCISGFLNGKTRLLVTHQLQFLPSADLIIVMKLGKITDIGTYEELNRKGVQFNELDLNLQRNQSVDSDSEAMAVPQSSSSDDSEDLNTQDRKSSLKKRDPKSASMYALEMLSTIQDKNKGNLTVAEARSVGRVKSNVYLSYVKAWGPFFIMPLLLIFYAVAKEGFSAGQNLWLATWTDEVDTASKSEEVNSVYYLSIYYLFGGLSLLASIFSSIVLVFSAINASHKLYNQLVRKVVRLPMSFFDSQPAGRLLNRFTQDTDSMDVEVCDVLNMALTCITSAFFSLLVISVITPYVVAAIAVLSIFYLRVQNRYIKTTREIKRLDAIGLSPIFSHFNESLQGLSTIRAFRKQDCFTKQNGELVDNSNRCRWPLYSMNRWLSIRLDIMSAFIVLVTAVVVIATKRINAGLAGMALTSALNLTELMNWMVRQISQLELIMNSIERITEYQKYDSEKDPIIDDKRPPMDWPQNGAIVINNLWVRYRDDLVPVLKDVTFTVHPHEKIGVCGRTGSGKSTLMMALYRIVEPYAGSVYIDDINVLEIGLFDLRSKLSLVPQDPVIFSGTIRSNLDPMNEHTSDAYIWNALRQVGLHDFVAELNNQLDAEVSEGGQNLSVGQKQLLCMARALLRESKLLVLDEATSNVDNATDAVIQTTIRSAFKECTVLTIAHRLHTIIDYDRVMVLDDGHIAEFDTPKNLLSDPDSMLSSLVQKAGKKAKKKEETTVDLLNKVDKIMKEH